MRLTLIAAVARNGVIGQGKQLPWRLSEDLRFFKQATLGHAVIMGRKTWDSLPLQARPLPGRRNIVVTRNDGLDAPGAECVASLDAALQRLDGEHEAFVIGGAEIYALALPAAQRLLLTEIDHDADGDVHFPHWPRHDFIETARTQHDAGQGFTYQRATYERKPRP